MSEIPQAVRIDLLEPVRLLHEHLTAPLCEAAFEEVRGFERRRVWTLERLAEFWVAVVLRAPPSLTHALEEATAGRGGYPRVEASPQAFFARCMDLSGKFFARVFEVFGASVAAAEPPRFCPELAPLFARFAGHVFALDGSTLDPVARRLKVLWDDKRLPMPGSVEALYDLGRGTVAALRYDPTPQGVEQLAAREVLPHAAPGTLVVADRLYGLPWFFASLSQKGVFGLARRHGRAKFTVERSLSRRDFDGGVIEDELGTLGTGRRVPGQVVRRITLERPGEQAIVLLTMAFAYADLEDVLVEPRKPGGNKAGLRAPRRARRPLPPPPERPKEPKPRRPRES